jgi:phenylacetate-CoA ligase
LARTIADDVYPYCAFYRQRFDRAGVRPGSVKSVDDLARIPLTTYDELVDGAAALVHPAADTIKAYGDQSLRWRFRLAEVFGGRARFVRDHIDPRYKPMLWIKQGWLEVASTADDLDALAELGRRTLERAGVRGGDHLVTVSPRTPDLAFWQLALGARAGGVAAAHLGAGAKPKDVVAANPTVLAGNPAALLAIARGLAGPIASVRTVLAAGAPIDAATRERLADLGAAAVVVNAWAPAGARALWAECREGGALHTWPDHEVIEILDPDSARPVGAGEVVWTGVGWRGTALVRLRTGVFARLHETACRACGRTTPRLEVLQ